jgi:hypothetical protein
MIFFQKNKKTDLFNPDKNLSELANEFETDKGTADKMQLSWGNWSAQSENEFKYLDTWGYTTVYERYMQKYRNEEVSLLEVGVCDHRCPFASPKMWASYFKNADLYAVDNFWGDKLENRSKEIEYINSVGVNFIYADQNSSNDWDEIEKTIPSNSLDFIIEDGSHYPHHMMYTLYRSIKLLKSGGIYFMEDIQNPKTSKGYWGYDNSNVLINMLFFSLTNKIPTEYIDKTLLDEIESNFTIKELYLDKNNLNYLTVLEKK